MRINKEIFDRYLGQKYFDGIGHGRLLDDDEITFLTFDKWKVFYDADPDNWNFFADKYKYASSDNICFPYYLYIRDGRNAYRLIKFPTRKEYKRFFRFYKRQIIHNFDSRENQQEILELAQIVGERAKIRTEEAQKKLQEDYKNLLSITCNLKSDDIQTYFAGKDMPLVAEKSLVADTDVYYPNSVPYRIVLKNKVKVYKYYSYGDNMSEYICYYLSPGSYTVSEEKFIDGIVYCKIQHRAYNRQNEWIRLSDIDGKEPL